MLRCDRQKVCENRSDHAGLQRFLTARSETLTNMMEKVSRLAGVSCFSFKRDIGKVVEALYGENPPPVMIIGHSMGGAIAVHTAIANHIPSLLGLCVIDVVEGKSFLKWKHLVDFNY